MGSKKKKNGQCFVWKFFLTWTSLSACWKSLSNSTVMLCDFKDFMFLNVFPQLESLAEKLQQQEQWQQPQPSAVQTSTGPHLLGYSDLVPLYTRSFWWTIKIQAFSQTILISSHHPLAFCYCWKEGLLYRREWSWICNLPALKAPLW